MEIHSVCSRFMSSEDRGHNEKTLYLNTVFIRIVVFMRRDAVCSKKYEDLMHI